MLCIILERQLHCVVLKIFVPIYFIVVQFSFEFCSSFVRLSFSLNSLLFIVHCSKDKIFNSDPGLYSMYFDRVVCKIPVHHHLSSPINIIHQTAPTLS